MNSARMRKQAAASAGASAVGPSSTTDTLTPAAASLEVIDTDTKVLPMRVERAPDVVLKEAGRAAKALQDVIASKKHKVVFNGEQYLELEDWQTLGRFYGLSSRITHDRYISYGDVSGFEAYADVIRTDGVVVSSATAMCLNDERNWKGKPLFQLRSMAQSRASGKAFRLCLSWVAVLAGYRGTPAEEMDGVARTIEQEVVPLEHQGKRESQGELETETVRPDKAIVLTPEQKKMLTALGNTLEPKWLPGRYVRELNQAGAFLPVRDKLLGLHREQCGPTCEHWTDAIKAMGNDPEGGTDGGAD